MSTKKGIFAGLATFIITMAIMLTAGYWIQYRLGLYGVAITELMFLVIVAAAMFIFKLPFKEVFNFKIPQAWHIGGGLAAYAGTYMLVIGVSYIQMYLFPEMMEVNQALSNIAQSKSFIISLFIMAVMPAFCEEALHRGFILRTFSGIKWNWVIVLMMGVIFGIFHADPYRFLATAILGGGLSYIALKTENFWMPVLFHFLNNLMSVVSSFTAGSDISLDFEISYEMAVGYFITFSGIALFFLYLGWKTLNRRKANTISRVKRWIIKIVAALMVVAGFYFIGTAALNQPIFETSVTTAENFSNKYSIGVAIPRTYDYSLEVNNTYVSVKIIDSQDKTIYEDHFSADHATVSKPINLTQGNYTFELVLEPKEPNGSFAHILIR